MYQLTDLFILLHLHFVKNNNRQDEDFWLNVMSQAKKIWQGYTFDYRGNVRRYSDITPNARQQHLLRSSLHTV